MNFATWSVKNRVAVNLLTITVLIAGFFTAANRLQLDLFPDVSTNFITISTLDLTTSLPEDIERTITIPIEEELANVKGVIRIRSTSQDNFSNIFLEIDSSITDLDPVLNETRQAVDQARSELPRTAEDPVIEKFDIPFPLVTFSIAYPAGTDLRTVRGQLESIKRKLKIVPGVSDILVDGMEEREVWIEADPFRLQAAGLTFPQLTQLIQRKNINRVGGRLDASGGQRVVRILGEIENAADLETLPIKSTEGKLLLLRDVATVKETFARAERIGRTNLKRSITFTVVKKKGSDAIETVTKARKVFTENIRNLPPGFECLILSDSTKFIRTRVDTVLTNGIQALLLVTFLLVLLVNWRLALVVAFGIPVSFAGCFLVLAATGNSVNLLTLFAMIMALGMVVDDAIVVSENAYRYLLAGLSPAESAIKGVSEVFWPVLGSVSTTVAAFLPLIWGEGLIIKFLGVVPIVVVSALIFSLIQAFLVLPSHLADFVRPTRDPALIREKLTESLPWWRRWLTQIEISYSELREFVEKILSAIISIYLHLLTICLRWRYWTLLTFVGMLVAVGIAVSVGVVKFKLFATDFADQIFVKLELPADSTLAETEQALQQVEKRIHTTLPADDLTALVSRIGAQLDATDQFLEFGSNLAMITVDVDEQNSASRKASVIEGDLRKILAEFPGFTRATARAESGGPPVGKAVNAEIQGPDFDTMRRIAIALEERLRALPGVINIGNDFPRGKTEFQIRVDEARAAQIGLDVSAIADSLQAGFRGIESSKIRWGNDEVTLRVKMDERYAHDPEMLRSFKITNPGGTTTQLSAVASIERTGGVARIKRVNQERVLTVSADVDDRVTTSAQVNAQISAWLPELIGSQDGFNIRLTGENEDTDKSIAAMQFSSLIALLLIYALLATITNSFIQPVVIMSVIPFAIVGVFIGLIFLGEPLGLMSVMGTIALAGIVVNNSVVFVDFINRYRSTHRGGDEKTRLTPWVRWHSVLASGKVRFRPIFLTTATTVVGLLGLAFTSSGQEKFLAPMAQAVVFGLSFATLITMILIPCLYAILDDVRAWLQTHLGIQEKESFRA